MSSPFTREPVVLHGIGVFAGIVIGKAHLLARGPVAIPKRTLSDDEVPKENRRFRKAIRDAKKQLGSLRDQFSDTEVKDHLFILDAHALILEDRMITDETAKIIRQEKVNAEAALAKQVAKLKALFADIEDPYLRERTADIDHVADRVLRNLTGDAGESLEDAPDKVVLVAHDFSPADTAQMSGERVAGFLTDVGGPTSHTAIMARALEIPSVVGLEKVTGQVESGCPLIVDGRLGKVILYPSRDDYARYLRLLDRFHRFEQELRADIALPAVTRDGQRVRLAANIEMNREIPGVIEAGGEGIGLYRTEYLYLNRESLPSEEEQYAVYREVAERTAPHPAVIRTIDLGGDKFLTRLDLASEMNPALGLRAIRLCLLDPELLKTQFRAILRASAHGSLQIMIPMVSGVGEVRQAQALLEECRVELSERGQEFDEDVPLGCMIETPSSVAICDLIAREVDFLSIGTNDLIQYAIAIDRVNEHVAHLYQPTHPAILRMVRQVVRTAGEQGVPVSLCGEMAGDPLYTMVLLGLGLTSFSMTPHSIPIVKRLVRSVTQGECRGFVGDLLDIETAAEIEEKIKDEMSARFPELFAQE